MRAILAAFMMILAGAARGGELLPFNADTMADIRQELSGKPFLLALWSVHCGPCREEMPQWRTIRERFPELPVLLVAADTPGERALVTEFLAGHDLGGVRTYAFDDAFVERIRYSVDPRWRGELPRTYYFDAAHKFSAKSGRLGQAQWDKWFGAR